MAAGQQQAEDRSPTWTLPATSRSVAQLRAAARTFCEEHGADVETVHLAMLAVTEAATNAVVHAFVDREPGRVGLRCEAAQGELVFEVHDDGRGMQPRSDSPGLGMGLPTMGKVAARMDVRSGPGGAGTAVRMVFRAPGVTGDGVVPRDEAESRLLVAASALAGSAAWPQEGFERLCHLVLGPFADVACVDVAEHGTLRRLAAAVSGDEQLGARLQGAAPPLRPGTATWAALRGGGPQLVVHDPSVPRSPTGTGHLLGLGWRLAVPLVDASGDVLACWGMGGRGARPVPDAATLALMAEAGARAAGGLANANVLNGMQATRRRLEQVLAALGEAVSVTDPEGRFAYANEAAARLFGATSPAELLTRPSGSWLERFTVTDEHGRPLSPDELPSRKLHRGEPAAPLLTRSVERATGRTQWLRTTSRRLDDPDGPLVVNIVEDVTQAVRGEHRRQTAFDVGVLLDATGAGTDVLQRVAERLAPGLADGCALDVLDPAGALRRVALAHPDPEQLARLARLEAGWPASGASPRLAVLGSGAPLVVTPITPAVLQAHARDPAHLELLRAIAPRAMVVVALRAAGRAVGLLTLCHDASSGRVFALEDVDGAADLGRRIGMAVAWPPTTGRTGEARSDARVPPTGVLTRRRGRVRPPGVPPERG